jgi:phosphoribosyl-AMP cyclohydrolase
MKIDFEKGNGLIAAIAQDWKTKEVLMCAFMNKEAFELTKKTGYAHYFSRSRKRIWKKGEESGNLQKVKEIRVDCDGDAVLLIVEQKGGACHEGYKTCFFRDLQGKVKEKKLFNPKKVYGGKK